MILDFYCKERIFAYTVVRLILIQSVRNHVSRFIKITGLLKRELSVLCSLNFSIYRNFCSNCLYQLYVRSAVSHILTVSHQL
jgi:hypothetical protein